MGAWRRGEATGGRGGDEGRGTFRISRDDSSSSTLAGSAFLAVGGKEKEGLAMASWLLPDFVGAGEGRGSGGDEDRRSGGSVSFVCFVCLFAGMSPILGFLRVKN